MDMAWTWKWKCGGGGGGWVAGVIGDGGGTGVVGRDRSFELEIVQRTWAPNLSVCNSLNEYKLLVGSYRKRKTRSGSGFG